MDKRRVSSNVRFSSQGQIQIKGQSVTKSTMCVFSRSRYQRPEMSDFFNFFVNSSARLPRGAFFVLTEPNSNPNPTMTMAIKSQPTPSSACEVPFSPPPSRKQGQVSTQKQLQVKEKECRKEKVIRVRRSTRAKIDETRTRIRKMIEDDFLAVDSTSEDEDEDDEDPPSVRGEDENTLDLCSNSNWRWEIVVFSSYLRLGESSIESNGVFANYDIPAHVSFIEYKGKRISSKDVDYVEACHRAVGEMHDYMFRIDETVTIDATYYESGNLSKYINHSCSPNAYSCEMIWRGKKRIVLVSLREILEGEEITYDYLFPPEPDPAKRVACNCQSLNCRRYIN